MMKPKCRYKRQIIAWTNTIEKYQNKINKDPNNKRIVKHYTAEISRKLSEINGFKKAIEKYEASVMASKIKPVLDLEKVNKVKNIVCKSYDILPEDIDSTSKGTLLEAEAKHIYLYFLAVYFKGVPRLIMGEQIGKGRQSIDYGYNSTVKRKETDRHFSKSLKEMSEKIALELKEEVKENFARRPKIIQIDKEEPVMENAVIRTSKEMPTILNEWLKPLSRKKLKGEVVKPVYF